MKILASSKIGLWIVSKQVGATALGATATNVVEDKKSIFIQLFIILGIYLSCISSLLFT